jgi:glycosyltransferase involved in cell wall biosynthesis
MGLARRHCAQRVIAVSDAARDAYLARRWDTPDRVVTVRNGILGETRPGARGRVRAELGVSDDSLVVGMVSVLRAGKGHDIAARAIATLREAFPQLRLLVLGTGPDEEEIGRQLGSLGEAVTMAGHRDDVLEVIDAMDVLIHPTLIDALPTALIEAMAASTPVVATAVGGIPEIVEPGATGVLIDAPPTSAALVDALRPLLADPGLRRRLGEAGRTRFLAEFTVDRWMQRLLPVYRDAIAERDRRRRAGARSATTGR